MTLVTARRSLFAEEPPSTILFPVAFRGPQTPVRKRPCTSESTLRDVWDRVLKPWLIEEGTAATTIAGYQMDLCRWEEITSAVDFGDGSFGPQGPPIYSITRELLKEVRERITARCKSPYTANRMMRSINTVLHRASPSGPRNSEGEGLADEWLHLRMLPTSRSRKRIATTQQISQWYQRAEGATWPVNLATPAPLWWRTLLVIFCTYGPRTTDLLTLDWLNVFWEQQCPHDDINLRNGYGWLIFTPGKTRRKKPEPLILPLTKHAHAHLHACWVAADKPRSGLIFKCPIVRKTKRTTPGGQASPRTVQERLHEERCLQQRRAGLTPPFTFKELRKTANTWLRNVDQELGPLVLGHASRDVNDRYYYEGVKKIRDCLPSIPMPTAFDQIFLSPDAPHQRLMFQDE